MVEDLTFLVSQQRYLLLLPLEWEVSLLSMSFLSASPVLPALPYSLSDLPRAVHRR